MDRAAPQTRRSLIALLVAASATAAFGVGFHFRLFRLGVPGELEVPRLGTWDVPISPWIAMLPAAAVGGTLVAFVVWSLGWVETARRRSFVWSLVACIALGGTFQLFLEIAAPHGLQKWAVLHHGFRAAARLKFDDVSSVFANHALVASEFEPNHVSANPAGWIVIYRVLLSFFDNHSRVARAVWHAVPGEISGELLHNFGAPVSDQAAIAVVALVSRLLAMSVGFPVAWLVCQRFGRSAALAACAMAYLVPAAPLLSPAVDTVYPTFAALIVALGWYASQRHSAWAAAAAGGLVGLGMFFSLCFLVVAALCALMVALRALGGQRPTGVTMLAAVSAWLTVIGFFAVVFRHRLWESWSVNLAKNHEFNACCGCTYGVWTGVNLLELAVAMGIPAAVFLLFRVPLPKGEATLVAAWLLIVILLDLSGTNRGEISRLWLFLMPLGVTLAVEWLDTASRRGRTILGLLLLLQAFNCVLLARELVLLWPSAPRQIQEQYLASPGGKWASYRRLSDEEIGRRKNESAR